MHATVYSKKKEHYSIILCLSDLRIRVLYFLR